VHREPSITYRYDRADPKGKSDAQAGTPASSGDESLPHVTPQRDEQVYVARGSFSSSTPRFLATLTSLFTVTTSYQLACSLQPRDHLAWAHFNHPAL
jgi:hypothetical protein